MPRNWMPLPCGHNLVETKLSQPSVTLSMAYAGFVYKENVLLGLHGKEEVVQCAFAESTLTDATYFASRCKFGPNGVEQVLPYGTLSPYEQAWLDKLLPESKQQIQKGVDFVNKN